MNEKVTLEDLAIFEKYIGELCIQLAKGEDVSMEAQQSYVNWVDLIERMKENHFSARHYDKARTLVNRLHGVLLYHKALMEHS